MPVRPWASYFFTSKQVPFEGEFFRDFWENTFVEGGSVGGNKNIEYTGKNEETKKGMENFRMMKKRRREGSQEPDFYSSPERYQAPFLSIPQQLLQGLKEDLVNELIIISSYRKGKLVSENRGKFDIFNKTFGRFPNCKISIYEVGIDKERGEGYERNTPHRWEWIRDNHPDFDIFIDNNNTIISSARKNLGLDKIFVLPDYKYSRKTQAPNIYHVKTEVSNLKDQDFEKAVQEYKDKKTREGQQNPEQKDYQTWIIYGLLVGIVLALLFVIFSVVWVAKKRKNLKRVKN